jgi:hypothetical protein
MPLLLQNFRVLMQVSLALMRSEAVKVSFTARIEFGG